MARAMALKAMQLLLSVNTASKGSVLAGAAGLQVAVEDSVVSGIAGARMHVRKRSAIDRVVLLAHKRGELDDGCKLFQPERTPTGVLFRETSILDLGAHGALMGLARETPLTGASCPKSPPMMMEKSGVGGDPRPVTKLHCDDIA